MVRKCLSLVLMNLVLVVMPVSGETLDRIVVVIDNTFIITQSDIRKERAIQSALGSKPGDDQALLDALIERHLVEEQIQQFREIDVPEEAIEERLKQIGNSPGVSIDDLRDAVIGELRRYDFMVQRFRQFIRVSDEELRKYYEDVYVPELRRRGAPVPPAEEGMESVRPNVIAEKMDEEVSVWMADLRRRSTIEILK